MQKLNLHTKNKADENFGKLSKLFPNAITETVDENGQVVRAIDKDVLMQEISHTVVDGKEERYQFTWPDKKKSIVAANAPINKTLRPCKEESKNFDDTENLYIEGDNLEVLKLLQETYLGKVKMIYIDPPYNTGNDFVYEDDFAQSTGEYMENSGQYDEEGNRLFKNMDSNGRFHTDWLNMIYPRLKLAKDLLTDDGVVLVSIDDNEVANLHKICDDVYGNTNFIAKLTIIVKTEGRRYGYFAKTHENVFVYAKNIDKIKLNEIEIEGSKFNYSDKLGGFNLTDLRNQNARAFNSKNRPNLRYPFYVDESSIDREGMCKVSTNPQEGFKKVWAITVNNNESVWRWGKETAEKQIEQLIARKSSDGEYRVYQKYRKLTQIAKTVWFGKDIISNRGTKELQEVFGFNVFDFPKPVALLKQILIICSNEDDIILDFFSGSATTAHAVMQLNAEDDGNRKFIMVQLPEETDEKSEACKAGYKNICEIGKERIRRAGEKIASEVEKENSQLEIGKEPKNIPDIGFRVLKCDSSNMKDIYYNPEDIFQTSLDALISNIKEDRTPEDLLFQVMLDLGVLLSSEIKEIEISNKKVFDVADNYLIACFDNDINEEVIEEIAKKKPYYFVMRDSSLKDSSVSVNFEQLFKAYSPDTVRMVI